MTGDDWADANRAVYDDFAEAYAESTSDYETFPGLRDDVAAFASSLPAQGLVLDAGCGAGRDLDFLIGRGFHAVGIDISRGLLVQAERRFPGTAGCVVQADVRSLPLPDTSVVGIWCSGLLVNTPHVEAPAILKELARVMVAGATVDVSIKQGEGESWGHGGQISGRRLTTLWHAETLASEGRTVGLDHVETMQLPRAPWAIVRFRRTSSD